MSVQRSRGSAKLFLPRSYDSTCTCSAQREKKTVPPKNCFDGESRGLYFFPLGYTNATCDTYLGTASACSATGFISKDDIDANGNKHSPSLTFCQDHTFGSKYNGSQGSSVPHVQLREAFEETWFSISTQNENQDLCKQWFHRDAHIVPTTNKTPQRASPITWKRQRLRSLQHL